MNEALFTRYLVILGGQVFMAEMVGDADLKSVSFGNLGPLPAAPLAANEQLAFNSEGYGRALPATMLHFAKAESNTDTLAHIMPIFLIRLRANDQHDTYLIGNIQSLSAAIAAGDGEMESESNATLKTPIAKSLSDHIRIRSYFGSQGDSWCVANAKSDAEIISYTKCSADAVHYTSIDAEAHSWQYTDATMHACLLTPICAIDENETYSEAILRAIGLLEMTGESKIDSDSTASCIAIPLLKIGGTGESFVDGEATAYMLAPNNMQVYANMSSDASCRITFYNVAHMPSEAKSYSTAFASLGVWYLPTKNGTNLHIRQAYDAIKNNTNLEVK